MRDAPTPIAATITPQHLRWSRNALFAGGLRPHFYCLPILKRESHRQALVEAATSGNPRFFLGTDSAPHPRTRQGNGVRRRRMLLGADRACAVRGSVRRRRRARQARRISRATSAPTSTACRATRKRSRSCAKPWTVPQSIRSATTPSSRFARAKPWRWRVASATIARERGEPRRQPMLATSPKPARPSLSDSWREESPGSAEQDAG